MRRLTSWLKIGPRIYLVIAIMAALTIGIGWMGIFSMDRYETQSNQMSALSDRALISERVLGRIVTTRGESSGAGVSMLRPRASRPNSGHFSASAIVGRTSTTVTTSPMRSPARCPRGSLTIIGIRASSSYTA